MKRTRLRFGLGAMIGLVALALPAVAPAASYDLRATGTVIAEVQYRDRDGMLQPLADVEVWLFDGTSHYACTDIDGEAMFPGITANTGLTAATGIGGSSLHCANAEFVNPDSGKRMLTQLWNEGGQVSAGGQKTIDLEVVTPQRQQDVCGGRETTIVGTNGPDVIWGTAGDDVIDGRGGKDVIDGKGGNDVICGGNGNDKLYGGDGDDLLFGEKGKDRLFGEAGDDILFGGPRPDRCRTGETLFSCER